MLTRSYWAGLDFPIFFDTDDSGGGKTDDDKGDTSKEEKKDDDLDQIEGLGDKGKAALKIERDARKAAEDREKSIQAERDALLTKERDREDADRKKREKEAADAGKFEELAATRETERDAAVARAETAEAENKKLRDTIKAGVDDDWKKLPDEIRKIGEKSHPEDDVLGRYAFITDPDTKALVAKLAGDSTEQRRGNGPVPPPRRGQQNGADDEKVAAANARRYG